MNKLSAQLQDVCKAGKVECCRYLVCGAEGFECAKHSSFLRPILDARVAAGTMRAKGDNCEGKPPGEILG